jgi:hypothetical protein
MKVPSGKNIGNITADINKTVIKGTPLQSSIKPIETYLIAGKDDLLPKAKNTPIGKQKSIAKAEIIKVNERPPQAALSTYSNPKLPPEISLMPTNGNTKTKNKMKYFLSFSDTKNETPTIANKIKNAVFILHCSASGYKPYINLLNQTFIKTQHAPSPVQSSFELPTKLASITNQFNKGGIDFINMNKVKRVNTALKLLELIFLFNESNELTPLNSILIKYNPINPIINGEK